MTLPPGHYILTHDVVNPALDKRRRYGLESVDVFPKGTRVAVDRYQSDESIRYIRVGQHGGFRLYTKDANDALASAIVSSMVPFSDARTQVEDVLEGEEDSKGSPGSSLDDYSVHFVGRVLVKMVERGLSPGLIREAVVAIHNSDEYRAGQ